MLTTSISIVLSLVALAFFWFAHEESIRKNFKKSFRYFKELTLIIVAKIKSKVALFNKNRDKSEYNGDE